MTLWQKIVSWVVLAIGKVHWKGKNLLTQAELDEVREKLIPDYYIILTHRDNHMSTFFTNLSNWLLTGKWGYWSHALMNMEDEVTSDQDFRLVKTDEVPEVKETKEIVAVKDSAGNVRLVEAVSAGVQYTPFEEVFDVQGVVLLKPKNMTVDHWTYVLEKAKSELGKPYDTLFNIASDTSLSCVELVRTALMAEPDYLSNFANFEALIKKHKNLTPQMYYDCGDFEPVYEVRKK